MAFTDKLNKHFLSFLLSGTILAGGTGCSVTKKMNHDAPAKDAVTEQAKDSIATVKKETQRLLYMSNGKLTRQQATDRAIANYKGAFVYPGRVRDLGWIFTLAAQTDYSEGQVPGGSKPLWENMQTLKNSCTIIGPMLAEFSARANIFYIHSGMSTTVGLWTSDDGLVRITNDSDATQDYKLLVETHETLHGIQTANRIDKDDKSWSIGDFQARCLMNEAAAQTVEYLIALELKKDGRPGPWNEIVEEDSLKSVQLLTDYVDNVLTENTPYAKALAATGKNAFYAQFKEQWWLDFYNNSVLRNYINLMTNAQLDPPCGKAYSLETARKSGYVSPAFNFTAGLDSLPSRQMLFGNNTRMKQAFDYTDLEHLAATLGRQDSTYLKKLEQLEAEKNPYLGMDFRQMRKSLEKPANKDVGALAVMNCIAGVVPCNDVDGKKYNAAEHKIKMR